MPPAAPVTNTRCMTPPFLKIRSGVVELVGEGLVALAAVEQMAAHCGARLRHRAGADRLHDVAVLLLEGFAVGALRHAGAAANGLARNDQTAEVFQKPTELRVA